MSDAEFYAATPEEEGYSDYLKEQRANAQDRILPGVQTPPDERSDADLSSPPPPPCPCGCGHPVAVKDGKPLRWARNGCRQRMWNAKHTPLDLSALSEPQRVRAERMVREAVKAAKLGQRRATVDADHPVAHEAAAETPDTRPSCRVRLDPDTWAMLGFIQSRRAAPPESFSTITKEAIRDLYETERGRERQEVERADL